MSNKKGMTLLMLIIYIIVSLVIISSIIFNITNHNDVLDVNKYVFQAKINEYMNQYDTMKSFYTLKGSFPSGLTISGTQTDSYGRTIMDYIPTMDNSFKEFLCINNGNISYFGLENDDSRVIYLSEMGIQKIN